jgi:hypothetical protein
MKKHLDFDFKFRPLRTVYILLLAGVVFWLTDSYPASLVTFMAAIDIEDKVGED